MRYMRIFCNCLLKNRKCVFFQQDSERSVFRDEHFGECLIRRFGAFSDSSRLKPKDWNDGLEADAGSSSTFVPKPEFKIYCVSSKAVRHLYLRKSWICWCFYLPVDLSPKLFPGFGIGRFSGGCHIFFCIASVIPMQWIAVNIPPLYAAYCSGPGDISCNTELFPLLVPGLVTLPFQSQGLFIRYLIVCDENTAPVSAVPFSEALWLAIFHCVEGIRSSSASAFCLYAIIEPSEA